MLKNRWKLIRVGLRQDPDNAKMIVTAAVILHNLLRDYNPNLDTDMMDTYTESGQLIPGKWREHHIRAEEPPNDNNVDVVGRRNADLRGTMAARNIREYLTAYYSDDDRGAVHWQWNYLDEVY